MAHNIAGKLAMTVAIAMVLGLPTGAMAYTSGGGGGVQSDGSVSNGGGGGAHVGGGSHGGGRVTSDRVPGRGVRTSGGGHVVKSHGIPRRVAANPGYPVSPVYFRRSPPRGNCQAYVTELFTMNQFYVCDGKFAGVTRGDSSTSPFTVNHLLWLFFNAANF